MKIICHVHVQSIQQSPQGPMNKVSTTFDWLAITLCDNILMWDTFV
jgi:hypothetical protein